MDIGSGGTHTSRTTSGSTRVRSSSPLSSLQHTPLRDGSWRKHFTGSGAATAHWLMDHTGGFFVRLPVLLRAGSGTDGAVFSEEDMVGADVAVVVVIQVA